MPRPGQQARHIALHIRENKVKVGSPPGESACRLGERRSSLWTIIQRLMPSSKPERMHMAAMSTFVFGIRKAAR